MNNDKRGKYKRTEKQKELLRSALKRRIDNGEKLGFQKGQKPVITKERNAKISRTLTGRKRPEITGKKHYLWTGKGKENDRIRHSMEYKKWKFECLKRDGHICQKCGQKGGFLEVDHIKGFIDFPDLRFEISNGVTLCILCHHNKDGIRRIPKTDLIIGAGQIGEALHNILKERYKILLIDREEAPIKTCRFLHICFGYNKDFIKQVKEYEKRYKPLLLIIHSTVPVGTSRQCNSLHSPIRGLHPNLEGGIRTFTKFIGGERASEVADYFRRAGLKVQLCDKSETTELMKLLDTEYYRTCIEFTKKAKELCDKHQVPFAEAYTLSNITYNEGYKELGHPEYQRPVLQPIMTPIGGHCLMPNSKLLD
jgi:5-methylcytosine-specific restriction endonuclease McrA